MSQKDEKRQETIEILGMTCTGCARTLENEFRKFQDIEYSVSFPDRNIVVTYCPATNKREHFENAIESHGYRVKGKDYSSIKE